MALNVKTLTANVHVRRLFFSTLFAAILLIASQPIYAAAAAASSSSASTGNNVNVSVKENCTLADSFWIAPTSLTAGFRQIFSASTVASLILVLTTAFFVAHALNSYVKHAVQTELKKESRNARRRLQRARSFPDGGAYPNGWYALATCDELKAGAPPLRVEALGRTFALYRGADSDKIFCVDAYCPHLGADMSREGGGHVCGNCLECPFHKWRFDGESGACVSTPDGGKPPQVKSAMATAYVVRDHYGYAAVWVGDTREPTWELPRIGAIDDDDAVFRGTRRLPDVDMHIQDWAENGVDSAHFEVLHSAFCVPWLGSWAKIPGMRVNHDGSFHLPEGEHDWFRAVFRNNATLMWRGKLLPWTSAVATVEFLGPGGINYLTFDLPKLGKVYLLESHTPTDVMQLETRFRWYADRTVPSVIAWYVIGSWYSQWESDIMVWGNKMYRATPPLRANDGPVMALRRWYKKFYPSSPNGEPSRPKTMACDDW